jgi:LacI family transcriptional regulator
MCSGTLFEMPPWAFEQWEVAVLVVPDPEPVEEWMAESKSHVVAPPQSFAKWFKKHQPEVIISKDSFVQPRFAELGLRVPRDVAFVDVFLESNDGRTAGVRQNHDTVGALAVEILAGQLHHNKYGIPEIPTTTYVEGTWFDGATCPSKR